MRSNYKPIGDYVKQIKVKNTDNTLTVENLRGIRINKEFMPSVANVTGTDLSKYKVVEKNQFAYNPMHVGRDEVLPISLLTDEDKIIVSPAYVIFEVEKADELLPEYLMMWCRREEFDRNAWFTTDNSVRGGFNWEDFCAMQLPVPSPEKQKEIVKEYHTIINRIESNELFYKKLDDTAHSIYNDLITNTSPENKTSLSDYVNLSKDTINPQNHKDIDFYHYSIPSYDNNQIPIIEKGEFINSNKFIIKNESILLSKLNPHFSRVWNLYGENKTNSICSTEFLVFRPKEIEYFSFILYFFKSNYAIEYMASRATGTSNSHQRIKPNEILDMPIFRIEKNLLYNLNQKITPLINYINIKQSENEALRTMLDVLLSKMATIED